MRPTSKSKKKIPKNIQEMSKETLQETLHKKKQCNAKAQETVIELCKTNVSEDWFLGNLQYINQCHFDDVTVERSITKICGYPLCDQQLEKVPAQQYCISTRYNKVFDITERKNFCSGFCYKSAMHIKKQLFTSPLWFRDQEIIPDYTVLKLEKSSLGMEVVFFPDKIKLESEHVREKENKTKIVNLNEAFNEVEEKFSDLRFKDSQKIVMGNIETDGEKHSDTGNETFKVESNIKLSTVKESVGSKGNYISKATKGLKSTEKETEEPKKIKEKPINIIHKIEKCIFEWFTLDTLFFLYEENKLKELFQDKTSEIKEILNQKLSMTHHYEKIDKMIHLYELLDADLDRCNEMKGELKPLPDYSVLKEEGKTLEVKVRAFYQGQLEIKQPEKEEKKTENDISTDSEPLYLPLVDAHAQISLRRKIVLDKLNRILSEFMKIFTSDYVLQLSEVRNLISTFTLSAHNITFKPGEWHLIGLIIIKLLSIKDKQLKSVLKLESSESHVKLILHNYELHEDYLENLIFRLTDYVHLIQKFNEINR